MRFGLCAGIPLQTSFVNSQLTQTAIEKTKVGCVCHSRSLAANGTVAQEKFWITSRVIPVTLAAFEAGVLSLLEFIQLSLDSFHRECRASSER